MIRARHIYTSILLGLIYALAAQAASFRVVTLDETGADFPDVLIVVRSLDSGRENFRALTDRSGAVPTHELSPGLYQLIATCPYGICQTTVQEFIVASDPIDLKLTLKVVPTTGNGVTIGPIEHRQVEVLDLEGRPLASVQIFVRDGAAQYGRWYRTGANGRVTIDLPPEGEPTIVAIYQDRLVSRVLQPSASNSDGDLVVIRF